MKKIYEKPHTEVVQLEVSHFLCTSGNGGEFGSRQDEDYNWEEEY